MLMKVETKPAAAIDRFGCPSSKLHKNQELSGTGLKFFRKGTDRPEMGNVSTAASDDGFLLGVSLEGGHQRRIFHQHHSTLHPFERDSYYLRSLSEDYRADMYGAFDFLLLEISDGFLSKLADEHRGGWQPHLRSAAGASDPVLADLMRAVRPALAKTSEASTIFLDQLGIAIGTHLIERHCDGRPRAEPPRRLLLSPSQLNRAKEMLRNHLDGAISIAEVATACGLSRGYFIRAFREATGQTPHRWMLEKRVERARGLLTESELALADVALVCGFADQSHFTRIFSRLIGVPPGNYRRTARI
ncbi:MAG: Transcriptional regulator, AraC family [Tardiphaga sp.]|jgi:AraC family transcriptional regulator|nr:Transcriptional regulator, AraC family [Tardiphaga sp.]